MQNFADQCLDMARSMLGQNLDAIASDGTILPVAGELPRLDEPGHAALAIGEYYRATGDANFIGTDGKPRDLIDLAARCITAQVFLEEETENGLGYAALGLLSFGPAKERNIVWERLLEPTRQRLDKRLLARTEYQSHLQSFNIAKAVARFSFGLSKKDETGKLIDSYLERVTAASKNGFFDDSEGTPQGVFDLYGPMSLVFIRQALQLHANIHLRERKLPSLRTVAEKYLKLLPDMVRADGLGWSYGRGIGAYGQMHCISLVLQALRDGWVPEEKKPQYLDILRRLFQFFFLTYLDQDHGFIVIRDHERDTQSQHTTRMANYDGARYLCQWARLAKSIGGSLSAAKAPVARVTGRNVIFDQSNRKEQGLFLYQDPQSGLHVQLPLVSGGKRELSDYLTFPHCPGVFDWPVNRYQPVLVPELTFGDKVVVPCFYGKNLKAGLGLRDSYFFSYEQPELITKDEERLPFGSCKVQWTFSGNKITSEFTFTVKSQVTLDKMRYSIVIGAPHSEKHAPAAYTLGEKGLGCTVDKDDFQAVWLETEVVTEDPTQKTYWGKLHYIQTLARDHALIMRPGHQYKLVISYQPDITFMS